MTIGFGPSADVLIRPATRFSRCQRRAVHLFYKYFSNDGNNLFKTIFNINGVTINSFGMRRSLLYT